MSHFALSTWRQDDDSSKAYKGYRESILALPRLTGPYVYVVRSAADICKIGCSDFVKTRLRRLEGDPGGSEVGEIVRLDPVFDARLAEACAHGLVGHRRVSGEWFWLEQREIEKLDKVLPRLRP